MSIGDLCNRNVVTVQRDTSAIAAADLMRTLHVGDLVVVEERDGLSAPVGIVTDRDLVVEVMAEEVDPETVTAADVMSFDLVTARENDDLMDTVKAMQRAGVRRMPVVDARGGLVGILTVDDCLELLAETLWDLGTLVRRERSHEEESRP